VVADVGFRLLEQHLVLICLGVLRLHIQLGREIIAQLKQAPGDVIDILQNHLWLHPKEFILIVLVRNTLFQVQRYPLLDGAISDIQEEVDNVVAERGEVRIRIRFVR